MNDRLTGLLELYKNNPNDSFIIYGIALEYKAKKNYSESEIYFKKLLELNPDYVPGYMQYAMLKEETNDISLAKEIYAKGIKKAKETGDTHAMQEMEEFLDELE